LIRGLNYTFLVLITKNDSPTMLSDFKSTSLVGCIYRGLNYTFLVLITKNDSLTMLSDFKSTSLVGCIYRILSKVRANRLKSIIRLVIYDSWSMFIKGRHILDETVITDEMVDQEEKRYLIIFNVYSESVWFGKNWVSWYGYFEN